MCDHANHISFATPPSASLSWCQSCGALGYSEWDQAYKGPLAHNATAYEAPTWVLPGQSGYLKWPPEKTT